MTEVIEILKYTLPSLIVLLAVYFILKRFVDFNNDILKILKENIAYKNDTQIEAYKQKEKEAIIPLKLQAYERIILFLERINPSNLIVREMEPGLSALQFHRKLLNSLQEEYEHNITQQMYVSDNVWRLVKNVKEEIMSLINSSAKSVKPDDSAIKLGEAILSNSFGEENDPVTKAIIAVKAEMKATFE